MPWTTYQDIQNRWIGDPFNATQSQVETLIADSEDTISREFPTIQARIDDESLPQIRVIKVTFNMVARVLRNPNGLRSVNKGGGPFQESVTYGGDEPGALYLTEQDKRELAIGIQGQGDAFGIDMTPIGYTARRSGNYPYEPGWYPYP